MSSPPDAPRSRLEVRGVRASSVIVQRVAPADAAAFLEWQQGISAAVTEFPGYQSTEVYPPQGRQDEWVILLHFDDPKTLQAWLESPRRAEWIAKLPVKTTDYRMRTLPTGFGSWFADLDRNGKPLPGWKMALTVLFALYPIVALLSLLVGPSLSPLGFAVSLLVSNVMSVSLLQWVVMPLVNKALRPWLRANDKSQRLFSLGGLVVILLLLAGMAILFRLVKG